MGKMGKGEGRMRAGGGRAENAIPTMKRGSRSYGALPHLPAPPPPLGRSPLTHLPVPSPPRFAVVAAAAARPGRGGTKFSVWPPAPRTMPLYRMSVYCY